MKKLLVLFASAMCLLPMQAQEDLGDITVDAQIRTRGEYRNGYSDLRSHGTSPATSITDRSRLGIGWERYNLEMKLSAQHTGIWGNDNQTNNSGTGNIAVNEAWAKYKFMGVGEGFVQVGRQVLSYDDERLLGADDWAQTGRSHDAVRVAYKNGGHEVHLIAALNRNKTTDNDYDSRAIYKNMQALWYHYDAMPEWKLSLIAMNQGIESAYLDHPTQYMQTVGTYISLFPESALSGNASFYYQLGHDYAEKSVSAYLASVNVKCQFTDAIDFGAGADYISGTAAGSTSNNTFDVLYGSHHKFYGAMDYFNNSNMPTAGLINLNANAGYKATEDLSVRMTYSFFMLAKDFDYKGLTGFPSKSLGHEFDIEAGWNIQKYVSLNFGYSVMFPLRTMGLVSMTRTGKPCDTGAWQDWGWISLNINPTIFSTKKK